ncbi:minor capsid protein [Lacticaseibacillus daqingensis]|uniref:minor capsid protein n=1 Tax=Lacticaseibacillus daqingensis TaxID=2486014 RepID=UPI000F7A1CD5|nr:minor capsid protein [Lacticaseibacillus daqingensis]
MGGVKIKVQTNIIKIHKKLSKSAFQRGRRALANQVGADSNRFVPAGPPQKYNMRKKQLIAADSSSVTWLVPYAHRQYYAPAGWTYTTPGTGPKWVEVAKTKYMGKWVNAFKKEAGL